jgi:hypothetical protein
MAANLEERVAKLEAEIAVLRSKVESGANGVPEVDGWKKNWGIFNDSPEFEEAMRLGREWRESYRPKTRKTRKAVAKNGRKK